MFSLFVFVLIERKSTIETKYDFYFLYLILYFQNELIPNSDSEEGKVFYYKMKGDYHRYLAEVRMSHFEMTYYISSHASVSNTEPTSPTRIYFHLSVLMFFIFTILVPERWCPQGVSRKGFGGLLLRVYHCHTRSSPHTPYQVCPSRMSFDPSYLSLSLTIPFPFSLLLPLFLFPLSYFVCISLFSFFHFSWLFSDSVWPWTFPCSITRS